MKEKGVSQNIVNYILDMNERLNHCQELAVDHKKECQIKRKNWYNKNSFNKISTRFKVEDSLLVLETK